MHNQDKIEKENVTLGTVFLIVNLLQLEVVAINNSFSLGGKYEGKKPPVTEFFSTFDMV